MKQMIYLSPEDVETIIRDYLALQDIHVSSIISTVGKLEKDNVISYSFTGISAERI